MEWEMRMPSWDWAELERDAAPNIGSVVASSSSGLELQKNELDCSVDLKLGGFGDFGSSSKDQSRTVAASVASLPASSSKRARAPSNSSQNVSCLVDGCTADLSSCRDYHRRHKVCETHSKTPMVLVGGQEQRFCQQCSRFHLLVEFDEVKRSCRKRLDGHNRRRRKPQPEPMNSVNFITDLQGTRFSSYPQIFPTATSDPNWSSVAKNGETALYQQNAPMHFIDRRHFPSSYSHSFKEGKHFPFLQDTDTAISSRTTIEASVCQPLLNTISFSESSGSSSRIRSKGLTQVLDSDCALSLLSSRTQTPGINLGHMVSADRVPVAQPLVQSLQSYGDLSRYSRSQASNNVSPTGFSCSGMGNSNEHVGTIMVADATDTDLHCHGPFHMAGDGPSGVSNALPFSWH